MIWNLKTIIAAIIAAIISAAVFYNVGHYFGDGAGYDRHKTEMETLQAKKAQEAQKKITDIRQRQNDAERNIDDALNDDCDLVYSTINSLRK